MAHLRRTKSMSEHERTTKAMVMRSGLNALRSSIRRKFFTKPGANDRVNLLPEWHPLNSSGANSASLTRISDEEEDLRGAQRGESSGGSLVGSPGLLGPPQSWPGGQTSPTSPASTGALSPEPHLSPRAERQYGSLARPSTSGEGASTPKGSSFGRFDRQWRKLFHSNSQDHHDDVQKPIREKHSLRFRRQEILNSELYAHRSKSLTQIDCLGGRGRGDMLGAGGEESSYCGSSSASSYGPCPDRLAVPPDGGGPAPADLSARSMLSRGTHKVPSQEYLSVTVECEDSRHEEMDLVPVTKGVPLRDALSPVLERRGLAMSSVSVFEEGSARKPANLATETQKLAGCHFRVKVKEGYEAQSVARANSTSSLSSAGGQWRGGPTSGGGRATGGAGQQTPTCNLRDSSSSKDQRKMAGSSVTLTGSQRGRRGGLSTEDLASEVAQVADGQASWKNSKGRQALGRKAGLLATAYRTDKASQDKEEMRTLTELLNQYAQSGIPPVPFGPQNSYAMGSEDESLLYIEDSWRMIVDSPEILDKQVQSQQEALWELLATEASYIRTLKVVVELFLSTLCNLQNNGLLNDIDVDKMFSNIVEIYEVNRTFWRDSLLPVVHEGRALRRPLNPSQLREGFSRFEELFEPYVKYCLDHATCLAYVKENRHESVLFKSYVAWCESQKECGRLRFTDLLVKPMQRLTKYSLLLKAILKKTEQPDARAGLIEMNDIVERFVCNVDARLRQRHELERLESIIGRIEAYEPFDTTNDEVEKALRDSLTLDLTCAMPGCGPQQSRQLVAEVPGVKMRDAASSGKIDVHCLLLTDILLLCKSVGRKGQDKLKVIRQPFVVERLVVRDLKDASLLLVYLNEYRVVAWYLQLFGQEAVLRALVDQLRKAQEQFARARSAAAAAATATAAAQGRHMGLAAYLAAAAAAAAATTPTTSGSGVGSGGAGAAAGSSSAAAAAAAAAAVAGMGSSTSSYAAEDADDDVPRPSLLTAAARCSPRSSSHSSLVHSHSGSIDMSDPASTSSQAPTVPCPTPLFGASSSGSPQGGRATSFELGELQRQDSSCQIDHLDLLQQHRSRSVETRTSSVSVTITSPRPERRAFLLKGCSPVGQPGSGGQPSICGGGSGGSGPGPSVVAAAAAAPASTAVSAAPAATAATAAAAASVAVTAATAGTTATTPAGPGSNTLTVSVPFQQQQQQHQQQQQQLHYQQQQPQPQQQHQQQQQSHHYQQQQQQQRSDKQDGLVTQSSQSIQIPVVSPTRTLSPHSPPSPRSLQRMLLHNPPSPSKPPLLKTKNVSGLVTHSAPASEGPSPVHSLDSSTDSTSASLNLQVQHQQHQQQQQQQHQQQPPLPLSLSDVASGVTVGATSDVYEYSSGSLNEEAFVKSMSPQQGQSPAGGVPTARTSCAVAEVGRPATPQLGAIPVSVVIPAVSPVEPPTPVQETPNPILPLAIAIHTQLPSPTQAPPPTPTQTTTLPSLPPSTPAPLPTATSTAAAAAAPPEGSTATPGVGEGRRKDESTPPQRPHRDLPPPPPRRTTPRPDGSGRLHPRRHHTADSFEHLKQSRDASIHKRLSWNCGQQHSDTGASCSASTRVTSSTHGHSIPHNQQQQQQQTIMAADLRSRNQCLSSESVYSSSGVSSTGSLLLSGEDSSGGLTGSSFGSTGGSQGLDSHLGQHPFPQQTIVINGIDPFEDDPIQEEDEGSAAEETPQPVPVVRAKSQRGDFIGGQPGSRIKIDISEVAESVASDADALAVHVVTTHNTSRCSKLAAGKPERDLSSPSLPACRANEEADGPQSLSYTAAAAAVATVAAAPPPATPAPPPPSPSLQQQRLEQGFTIHHVPKQEQQQPRYQQQQQQLQQQRQPMLTPRRSRSPIRSTDVFSTDKAAGDACGAADTSEETPAPCCTAPVVSGLFPQSPAASPSAATSGEPSADAAPPVSPQSKRQAKDLQRMKEILLDSRSFDAQDV